jgi:hypothetical protein
MIDITLFRGLAGAVLLLFLTGVCLGAPPMDSSRYISVDEIRTDMDAYCLTVFEGTEIEKFGLKVVSVIRNQRPGRDAILVMGTDDRFKHVGPVRGCSGSPVYIDGRMAGALAASWTFAQDPLYIVTPIESMLAIATGGTSLSSGEKVGTASKGSLSSSIDFSKPIKLVLPSRSKPASFGSGSGGFGSIGPVVLATSLPREVCSELGGLFEPLGLVPVAAGQSIGATDGSQGGAGEFAPGSVLTIPLVSGDISMAVTGTVTEVSGGKVYGFGHSFLGFGSTDLPMAAGKIHTVVASMNSSMKLGTPGPISGAIRADEACGVMGEIGAKAKIIPLRISISHFNDSERRTYNCFIANDRFYTPMLLSGVVSGAGSMKSDLPLEHTVRYKTVIKVNGFEPIVFENISSGRGFMELVSEASGAVDLLMNNPFGRVDIAGLDFDVEILPDNIRGGIYSVELSDSRVKGGQTVVVDVVVQSYMSRKTAHQLKLKIPEDLKPGQYEITVGGGNAYEKFRRKLQPYKFTARGFGELMETIQILTTFPRGRLYALMSLPASGVTIQRIELPDLPQTKTLLMRDAKRTITTMPYKRWIEQDVYTGQIISGVKTVKITVEKK